MISEVYNEDCMTLMARYPDKYFDIAIVDPPYGIDINESIGRYKSQKHSGHKKIKWDKHTPDKKYFEELFRVSKNQIIWGGNYFELPPNKCFLIWDKVFSKDLSFSMYEYAWASFNKTSKGFKFNPAGDRPKLHPTQKPVKLYDWLILNYAKDCKNILDTHLGSGSSRIAAHKAGLDFVGCEIDKEYFDASEKRFNNYKMQLRLF